MIAANPLISRRRPASRDEGHQAEAIRHRYRLLSTHGKAPSQPADRAIAMKTRLGNAIYWAGCVISALLVMVGLNSAFDANSDFERL
jgi:hypothetical protein